MEAIEGTGFSSSPLMTPAFRLQTAPIGSSLSDTEVAVYGWRDSNDATRLGAVGGFLWNGTTWDRARGCAKDQVLSVTTHTGVRTSAQFVNYNSAVMGVFLNILASPGGAQTLSLTLRSYDLNTSVVVVGTVAAFAYTAAGQFGHLRVGRGAAWSGNSASGGGDTTPPRLYDVVVTPSAAGNWQTEVVVLYYPG